MPDGMPAKLREEKIVKLFQPWFGRLRLYPSVVATRCGCKL
jgi:hypothetical protein